MTKSHKRSRTYREVMRLKREQAQKRWDKQRLRNKVAEPGPHELVIVLDQLKAGFNVAKIFRSAFAFGARGVHLINIGPFDPAPAKGAFKHVPAHFHESFADCHAQLLAEGYSLFALSPAAPAPLSQTPLPRKSAFIFGHEEHGLQFELSDYPDIQPLRIPQVGRMESLNVSVAAAIVMYEYMRHWGD